MASARRLVIASNRGPVSWHRDAGELVASRGAGGLVTALGGALQREPGTWVSVALSEADREVAAAHGGEGFEAEAGDWRYRLRLLDAGERFEAYYNDVANRLLWFTLHGLWHAPYEPTGIGWPADWDDGYVPVNEQVAAAIAGAADDGDGAEAEVHVQDYHLTTATGAVRRLRPQAPLLHYLHTPWVGPDTLRRLPDRVADEVMRGLCAADVVAFSSPRWTEAFRRCAVELLGARTDGEAVWVDGRRTVVADFTLGVDEDALRATAESDEAAAALERLEDELGDRQLIVRVDRTDLSKNILRGLWAYEALLDRYPEHRGRVRHHAHLNPSRQGVSDYRAYLQACQQTAERIIERFGEESLRLTLSDDYPAAVAAMQRSDVLFANPVLDGTNLVVKEGPVVNRRDGVVVLSRGAGAASALADGALLVNPFDAEAQAEALHRALVMDADERAARAQQLRRAATTNPPDEWFAAQRRLLGEATGRW
jgi:trehalose 6-phosphate synthase